MTKKEKADKNADKAERHDTKETKKSTPPVKKAPVTHKSAAEKENYRGIIRIAGKDMKGELPLKRALDRVRGMGHTMANAATYVLQSKLSLDPNLRIGDLTDEQIEKIDAILYTLAEHGLPSYLFNRRIDYVSGTDRHVIMNDLLFEGSQDVERDKKLNTWKGYRHTYGQKVRGQRTRNTGRTGMAVGVLRKAVIATQQPAAAAAKGGAAPAAPAAAPAGAAKPAEKKPAAPAAEKK